MRTVLLFLLLAPGLLRAQETEKFKDAGVLQVGLRSTTSLFGDEGFTGYGTGGQFRLRISKRLNTEWFADYILTDLGGLGRRADGHIGWSVMFYPFSTGEKKLTPYLLAGHCFDYTRVKPFSSVTVDRSEEAQKRWSSATQMGLGMHWHITEKFDMSFSAQYMIHLGKDLHYHIEEVNGTEQLVMADAHAHSTLEGHLLITASLNIRIADLW